MSAQLQLEIVQSYYRTTANRGHSATREHYEQSANGLLQRLRPWLPKNRNICCLDLACGCGETLYMLEREGFHNTIGVDLCREEIENARAFVRSKLYCCDVLAFLKDTKSRSVEFITALNFIEHLSKEALLETLREIARVLRPGGSLVVIVPNATSPFSGMTRHWDLTHEWAFVPNNLEQLAYLAGFSPKVEFRECGPVPHGIKSGIRFIAWQAIRTLIAVYLLIEVADTKNRIYTMDMLVRLTSLGTKDEHPQHLQTHNDTSGSN